MQVENHHGHDEHGGHGDQADNKKGQGLAHHEFDAPDGGHHDLLDSADLLFAHNGDAGQQHADDQQHHCDQAGHIVVFALQVGVEPGAHRQLHRHGGQPRCALPEDLAVHLGQHLLGVVQDDGGVVVVGAIG